MNERARQGTARRNKAEPEAETGQIRRVALYAFLVNLLLAMLKGALAIFSGSLAVTAGAVDSTSDAVASLVVYAGLLLSVRKTSTFPLGLYKIENVISVVVAFFVFFAGYEIASRVFIPVEKAPHVSLSVLLLLLVCALVTFLFGRYAVSYGEKTESPTLVAEGLHRYTDVLSTLVILISASLEYSHVKARLWGISIDQIAAALVLVFIAHTGWELLSNGMRVLLDASIDRETLEKVKKIIETEPSVVEARSLVGRNAGRFRYLQAQVRLRTNDLQKAHAVSEKLETDIRRQIPHVERVMIHFEPEARTHLRIAVPLADPNGAMGSHFGESPYYALLCVRLTDLQVESRKILENPHLGIDRGKGIRVAEWLIDHKVDALILREDIKHKGPGYVMSNAGVKVHTLDVETLDGALDRLGSLLNAG